MKVSDIMSDLVCSVEPQATLGEAATLMGERRLGSALVLEADRLVGIVTERDIVRALSQSFDAPTRPVLEWMTKDPRTVPPDTDVREALGVMVDGGFRHLPVTEGDRVVGVLSIRDVARALA